MKLPKKRWLILGTVALVIIVFVTYSALHKELPKVQTDNVLKKPIVQKVTASGKIEPVEKVDISAYVSAEVTKLYVKEGDKVEKGQLLVELDSTRYQANRDQARATLYSARAQRRLAEAQLLQSEKVKNRTKELFKQELVGEQELETAETTYKVNKATLEAAQDGVRQAQAALRLARDDLQKTVLKAPLDGEISRLNKEVGEIAMGSQLTRDIIMTVADLSRMKVVVEVDENDVVDIEVGDKAEIEVDALPDKKFKGLVDQIATSATVTALGTAEETTNFEVTVLVDEDVAKLRPGMSATADIITESEEEALSLPIQCITMRDPEAEKAKTEGEEVSQFRNRGKDALKEVVFKVDGDKVLMAQVQTGISSDTEIELTEGVSEGDTIVCGPYDILHKTLTNDMEVQVDNSAPNQGEKKK